MIKQLDKLILRSFIGPFIATFFIAFFVLMMQSLWKYIDDLVGKGLDLLTIGQFLWYASASLLTLAMPIAILISSIMTFGNLGESFELVAIKSSGISLLRFMRPLIIVSLMLCGITFMFANHVIPYAQLKFVTLYNDIYYKKPAFDLKEGVFFNHIPGYSIKIGEKDKDGKTIRNVLIYEQNNALQDNVITAKTGTMSVSEDRNFLEFNLQDGHRYQERGVFVDTSTEYIRLAFKNYKKLFDLSVLKKQTTDDSVFRRNFKMLSARQLNRNIDSLQSTRDSLVRRMRTTMTSFMHYGNIPDSVWEAAPASKAREGEPFISDSLASLLQARSLGIAREVNSALSFSASEVQARRDDIRNHKMEWHIKYKLSLACLILFFIGAPLGSIIRKGGLGMPLVVAIVFFLIFHLLNMFGEKFVKQDLTAPANGVWLSVAVLAPVGIFFTYKAMHDSQLFNKEYYYRAFRRLRNFAGRFRKTS